MVGQGPYASRLPIHHFRPLEQNPTRRDELVGALGAVAAVGVGERCGCD